MNERTACDNGSPLVDFTTNLSAQKKVVFAAMFHLIKTFVLD